MPAASQQQPAAPEPLAACLLLMKAQPLLMLPERLQPADKQDTQVRVLGAVKASGGRGVTCKESKTWLSPSSNAKAAVEKENVHHYMSICYKKMLLPISLIASDWQPMFDNQKHY